jgi:hypothetical protein
MDNSKEKTLALLSNRICEKCAKNSDDPEVVKHGCCIHFIDAMWREFHYREIGQQQVASAAPAASGNLGNNPIGKFSDPGEESNPYYSADIVSNRWKNY